MSDEQADKPIGVKWLTRKYDDTILAVPFFEETAKSITVFSEFRERRRRMMKQSAYDQLHDTWAEAHEFLQQRLRNEIVGLNRQIGQAQDRLHTVVAMKKPETAS